MSASGSHNLQNRVYFFGLFALLVIAVLWLMSDYLGVIAFSLVMVVILKPLHRFFLRHLGDRASLATALTLLLFVVALIVPAWIIISVTGNQLRALEAELSPDVEAISTEELRAAANALLARIPGMEDTTITPEHEEQVRQWFSSAAQWLGDKVVSLGMSVPILIAKAFIFLGVVGGLLPTYDRVVQRILLLSPLSDEVDRLYLRKVKAMIWSMFVGMFIIAVIQGLLMGAIFWIAAIPYLGPLTLSARSWARSVSLSPRCSSTRPFLTSCQGPSMSFWLTLSSRLASP